MPRMREGSTTDDYRNAMSGEGKPFSLGYEWSDKPHRLVYDLCGEVDHLRAALAGLVGDDVPESVRDVFRTNHRIVEARRLLGLESN